MTLKQLLDRVPDQVNSNFRSRKYRKGSHILMPGAPNDRLFILCSGEAEVYIQDYDGAAICLHTIRPCSCFGENEIFKSEIRTLGIRAVKDCEILLLDKKWVFEWMKSDFDFNLHIIEQLVQKLVVSSSRSSMLSFMTVRERVICSLYTHLTLGDLEDFSKQLLVAEVLAPRRSVNRAVAELCGEGLLQYRDKCFRVPDRQRLSEAAAALIQPLPKFL